MGFSYSVVNPEDRFSHDDIGVAANTQVTRMRNKNSNIQGRLLNVIKVNL